MASQRDLRELREPLGAAAADGTLSSCRTASASTRAGGDGGSSLLGLRRAGDEEDPVTVQDLQSYMARAETSASPSLCKLRLFRMLNVVALVAMLAVTTFVCTEVTRFFVAKFEVIWRNGFVAALFLGGLVFVLKGLAQWFAINVLARFLLTTIKLSKEGKEATPVLEWFKVWLPKMMKERGHGFRSVQPLFRKKDGSTFFSFFRDIRSRDKFELISWVMPGTHFFRYNSPRYGGSIFVVMHYWTGEAKKEGWDQSLTVMENVVLTCFDPFNQAMPYLMEMLSEAQERFAERDMDCLRFQEWHGWKEMWESTTPDERIAPNFKTLAFYPRRLLAQVESEVDQFLSTPSEVLLRAGLPLKLGFLFHGPPGTGKTNLVRYLAARYRLPINIIDCNSGHMDNIQLLHAVVSAEGIILFEDIDNLDAACGRVRESSLGLMGNKAQVNKSVTLDGLLNSLDGVHRGTQKRILIATTNYPEKLIPSIRRRGRFGYSLQIDYPQDAEIEAMMTYYAPSLPQQPIVEGLRAVEKRTGLRLSTAAAVDIIAKTCLQQQPTVSDQEAVDRIVEQAGASLLELQQSNRKRLLGTAELLELLHLEHHASSFYWAGLFDMRYVKLLNDHELEKIGVSLLGDRKKILDTFQYMEDTPPLSGSDLEKARADLKNLCGSKVLAFEGLDSVLSHAFPDPGRAKEVEEAFKEQGFSDIDVASLKELKAGDLKPLGVEKLGEINSLMRTIARLDAN